MPGTTFPERLRHYATDIGSGDWRVFPSPGLIKQQISGNVVATANNNSGSKTGIVPFELPSGFAGVAELEATIACGSNDAAGTGIELGFTSNADELPSPFGSAGTLRLVHSCGNTLYLYGPGGLLLGSQNPPGYFGEPRDLRLRFDAAAGTVQVWLNGNAMTGLSATLSSQPTVAAAGFQIDSGDPGEVWVDDFKVTYSP
ncbi:MAG: hypothetical protein R2991_14650 [Thermoanaerobaculia bacterium]